MTKPKFTEDQLKNEIWKQYKDTCYDISNLGRLRNNKTNRITIGSLPDNKSNRYLRFTINGKIRKAHRIIYSAFYPEENIDNLLVHHINDIKTDNRIENLQSIEASHHASHHKQGEKNNKYLGIKGQFTLDGTLVKTFITIKDIKNSNFRPTCVYDCINHKQKIHKGFTFRRFPIGYVPIIGKRYDLNSHIFGIEKSYTILNNTPKGQLFLF